MTDLAGVLKSRNGDLWVGSFDNGTSVIFNTQLFSPYVPLENMLNGKLIRSSILSLLEISDNRLLVGTDGQGLFEYSPESKSFSKSKIFDKALDARFNTIKTLSKDSAGKIWGGSWLGGMFCYDPATGLTKAYDCSHPGPYQLLKNHVWKIREDHEHNLWVSCLGDGVIKFSENGMRRDFFFKSDTITDLNYNSPRNKALEIECDQNGNIWIVFEFDGVGMVATDGTITRFSNGANNAKGLPSDKMRSLFVDSKNNVWVGTSSKGLCLWRNENFLVFNQKNGLVADDVQSIREDKFGNIWISSFNGVSIYTFDGTHLILKRFIPTNFENFLNHASVCMDKKGNFFYGGSTGLNQIDLKVLDQAMINPSAHVSKVLGNSPDGLVVDYAVMSKIAETGSIQPKIGQRDLFIDLSSSDINLCDQLQYAYTLEGFDKKWAVLNTGERRLVYTGLPEGAYTLKVKCRIARQEWGPTQSYPVRIRVHITESKWLKYFLLGALGALIFFFVRKEIENRNILLRQQALEMEKLHLEQQNSTLHETVKGKNVELANKSAEIAHQMGKFEEIKFQLKNLNKGSEFEKQKNLSRLTRSIEADLRGDDDWEAFRMFFDQANHNFSAQIVAEFPDLTPSEVRHAILIRLHLGTKEIGKILNITAAGVQKSRYRLKKHLALQSEDDLIRFIQAFDPNPKS